MNCCFDDNQWLLRDPRVQPSCIKLGDIQKYTFSIVTIQGFQRSRYALVLQYNPSTPSILVVRLNVHSRQEIVVCHIFHEV